MDKDFEMNKMIDKLYNNLTYFDQYGGSLIIFIFINIICFVIISYCYAKINSQSIISDWPNQRCKPSILPIAGFINKPEGVSISDFTEQNFTYCTQNVLSTISSDALQPLTFITSSLTVLASDIEIALQDIRAMIDKIRTYFQDISQEIMIRLMNIMPPLQKLILGFKDVMAKSQGVMTSGLFTFLGSYLSLQVLFKIMANSIISILITLSILIPVFFAIAYFTLNPYIFAMATSTSAIFILLSIPMAVILALMIDKLNIQTNLTVPKLKCFDKNTFIKMNNETFQPIHNIKIGDELHNGNIVTAVVKVETNGSIMYKLNNIIVSDTHIVKHNNDWIRVCNHPNAIKYLNYNEPYLYCLNTTNKIIEINDEIFADWDEIYKEDMPMPILNQNNLNNIINKVNNFMEIHTYLDGGFYKYTKTKLQNGLYKYIKDIQIGDVLENGEKVYGVVVINGKTVFDQFKYTLGKNIIIGGPNLVFLDNKKTKKSTFSLDLSKRHVIQNKYNKLYHLLTDTKQFTINNVIFGDYNSNIDFFLESKKNYYL
jgi:hypothetical protein